MAKWLSTLFKKKTGPIPDQGRLEMERQIQELRLELEETQRLNASLKTDLQRLRSTSQDETAKIAQMQVETLLGSLASPLTQIATLVNMVEKQGKSVQLRDILAICKALLSALPENGITLEGNLGASEPYNPDRHQLLEASPAPSPGQAVTIRFASLAYHGKLLRKAGVSTSSQVEN